MKIIEVISESFDNEESARVSPLAIRTLIKLLSKYSRNGHSDISTMALINEVGKESGEPFSFEELEAANNQSEAVRSLIDSANDDKVKLKNKLDIKNEDPKKEAENKNSTVSAMASRRASRKV